VRYRVVIEGRTFDIEVGASGKVWVNHRPVDVDLESINGLPQYSLLVDHRSYETHLEDGEGEGDCQIVIAGRPFHASFGSDHNLPDQTACGSRDTGEIAVCAPLPGLLVEVRVSQGQQVGEGDTLAVLESMKMNLELCAPRAGIVQTLDVAAGQEVGQGETLAVIASS